MSELQLLAERLARALDRIAILEAGQLDTGGNRTLLNSNVTIAANYSLTLEFLEVPDGLTMEIVSGGALLLIG